jgi:hypothetical protein
VPILRAFLLKGWDALASCSGGFDELHVERDGDVFAYEHSASLEGGVVGETEILAIDLCGGDEADALVAPGILGRLGELFNGEGDGLGDAVQGKVACDGEFPFARGLNAGRLEADGGKLFDVEEVGTLEVTVAVGCAGGNAGDIDGGFDGMLRVVGLVKGDGAGEAGELALDPGDHHVADFEFRGGVGGVEVPGGCGHFVRSFALRCIGCTRMNSRCNNYFAIL